MAIPTPTEPIDGTVICGGGGGGGSVPITIDVELVPEVLVNGTDVWTGTTFTFTKATEQANYAWLGPISGAATIPTFRALDPLDGNGAFWTILGNTGTNPAVNFLGTIDNKDLVIKTNNTEAIRIQAPDPFKTGRVGIGTLGGSIGGQLEVYRENNVTAANSGEVRSFYAYATFSKWQPAGVGYLGHEMGCTWAKDPAGYAPPPAPYTGGGMTFVGRIATRGLGAGSAPVGQYFEYAGLSSNFDYVSTGGLQETSDGQNGAYVFDGHINKPTYLCAQDGSVIVKQLAGNVKLLELGMHVGVAPNLLSAPATVSDGIQLNLIDKFPLDMTPATQVSGYVTCTPGSTAVVSAGFPDFTVNLTPRSTVRFNGREMVIATITDATHLDLTAPWSGERGLVQALYLSYSRVTVTNGTPTVTWSSGATFTTGNLWRGWTIILEGQPYTILSVSSTTSLILRTNFAGTSGTTNACMWEIYVAHQNNAINIQTMSDERTWNCAWMHSNGVGYPVAYHGYVKSVMTGGGSLFNRAHFIAPNFTSYDPLPAESVTDPGGITGCGNALTIDESYTAEMAGSLFRMTSPVRSLSEFIFLEQYDSTMAVPALTMRMAHGTGTFTGEYIACYKGVGVGAAKKFWVETNGSMNSRFATIGPRADTDIATPGAVVVVDNVNYPTFAGPLSVLTQNGAVGYPSYYANNQTAAFTGSFFQAVAGSTTLGVPSGSFTGKLLDYQYPAGTEKFFVDYRPQVVAAAVAAPAAFGVGFGQIYFDSADQKWHVVDGAGNHAI